jgi:SAM-dependent methyltransferase
MSGTVSQDVPSPIDLGNHDDAVEWEATADIKRPWRREFFRQIVGEVSRVVANPRVLELGSGPGFLLEQLIESVAGIELVALDVSAAMHQLAGKRLGDRARQVQFVPRNLRATDWHEGLGSFDAVVTNQAVHELRHKRHAPVLHAQVRHLLRLGGCYLVCDHYVGDDGMSDRELYMTIEEQAAALEEAGFHDVRALRCERGMVLHRAS